MKFLSQRHEDLHGWFATVFRDENAAAIMSMLIYATHIWDDLIDRDKEPTGEQINYAFWCMLVGIPKNPLYQALFQRLHPVLEAGVLSWMASNVLERWREPANAREVAHAARYAGYDVAVILAQELLGYDEAQQAIPLIKLQICPESIDSFRAEMALKYDSTTEAQHVG